MIHLKFYHRKNGCRFIIKTALFFLIISTTVFYCLKPAEAKADNTYAESLVQKARLNKIHKDRYWHTLLHYKTGIFGLRSLIDDPAFFLSDKGKHDPAAEIEETIRAFFKPVKDIKQHAINRFPARFAWLKEKLDFDTEKLEFTESTVFKKTIKMLKPASVTLVFPAGYINSPASMYGHTFLIIETATGSKLLANAVNYSAITNETFGPFFAVKGLLGMFKGYYSVLPYYEKVSEYSDFEKRDMWEYRLNLNKDEISMLLMHLAELEGIYSNYYFFDENCSYSLLFLLEAARPSVKLTTNEFFFTAAPVDTIRAMKREGLVNKPEYRPSKTTKINHLASQLSPEEQNCALDIAKSIREPEEIKLLNIPEIQKIRLCDLTSEYIQYRFAAKEISAKQYAKLHLSTLRVRSGFQTPQNGDLKDMKIPDFPDNGHKSKRLSIGTGYRTGNFFQEILFRPTYHSLIDPDEGYNNGSEIVFGDLSLRFYDNSRSFKVHYFDIIDVISIPPTDKYFFQGAWKLKTGLRQKKDPTGYEHYAGYLNTGGGLAFDFPILGRFYFLAEVDFNAADGLEHNICFGPGFTAGFINKPAKRWKYHVYSTAYYYALGEKHYTVKSVFEQMFKITTNTCIVSEYNYFKTNHSDSHEIAVKGEFFF